MGHRLLPALALVFLWLPAVATAYPPGEVLRLADPDRLVKPASLASSVANIYFAAGDALVAEGGTASDPVRIWDRVTGRLRHQLPVNDVRGVCLSADGRTLAISAARDLCLFDVATGRRLAHFPGAAPGAPLCFAPDGKSLWLTEGSGVAQRRLDDASVLRLLEVGGALAVSPDGSRLAALEAPAQKGEGYVVRLWDLGTGQRLGLAAEEGERPARAQGPYPLAFSPDGRLLAWSRNERQIRLSDLARARELPWLANPGNLQRVVFSPDGRLLARASLLDGVELLEVSTGRERLRFAPDWPGVTCVAFAPDGRLLALGHTDGSVSLWNAAGPDAGQAPTDFDALWADLAREERLAHRAIFALAALPAALPKLEERLRTFKQTPRTQPVSRWIAELDDDDFETRQRATESLRALGSEVQPDLRAALEARPSVEMARRLEDLLAGLVRPVPMTTTLRVLRAVEAVERTGSPEAHALLTRLAKQAADPLVRTEAEAGARRLAGR